MSEITTFNRMQLRWPVRALNQLGARRGKNKIDFSAAEIVQQAQRRTRLHDFGEDNFSPALELLIDSCQREARLSTIGKLAFRSDILRTLCNRLLMQRDREDFPKIAQQKIRQPLFITGLPRSGTTLLHSLLACDPKHRAPLTWEVMAPSPPTRIDERRRIRRARLSLSCLQWIAPTFRKVHAVSATLPQECISLMSPSFLSDQFDTMYYVPTYRAWFLAQDLAPAYRYHRRFLQQLQQRQKERRWVLKAPTHMFALETLLAVYPDACFVQTHRDPLQSIASVSSMIAVLRSIFSDEVDPQQIGADAMRYWSHTISHFLPQRDRLLRGRICDISYRELSEDPIGAARRVYQYFGWSISRKAEVAMRAALAAQPREQHGFHHYDAAQFGLALMPEGERFAEYCRRFGFEAPHALATTEAAA